MYIIKVNNGQEVLTYTFQNESWGKSGNDINGIHTFIRAFKKLFKDDRDGATLIIMNESGLFYKDGFFVAAKSWDDVTIPLNNQAMKDLEEYKTQRKTHEEQVLLVHE